MKLSNNEIKELFESLDVECWQCKGSGKAELFNFTGCDICDGAGRQLTRAGVELFNFLGRHRERVRKVVERAEIARLGGGR